MYYICCPAVTNRKRLGALQISESFRHIEFGVIFVRFELKIKANLVYKKKASPYKYLKQKAGQKFKTLWDVSKKNTIYTNKPETLKHLKQDFRDEIIKIPHITCGNTMTNAIKTVRICEAVESEINWLCFSYLITEINVLSNFLLLFNYKSETNKLEYLPGEYSACMHVFSVRLAQVVFCRLENFGQKIIIIKIQRLMFRVFPTRFFFLVMQPVR